MKLLTAIKMTTAAAAAMSLMGCAAMNNVKNVNYDPGSYEQANSVNNYVQAQKAKKAAIEAEIHKIVPAQTAVLSSYGFSQNPRVIKAYKNYVAGKKDVVVHSPGFITYPYSPYSRPIITCAPLRVCTIQLEKGEKINSIQIGDSARWLVTNFLTGPNAEEGSESIAIKPLVETPGISTDLVISTNKRVYTIGLLSDPNSDTHVVNFYYPTQTLRQINEKAAARLLQHNNEQVVNGVPTKGTVVNEQDIHTNYTLSGDKPAWSKGMEVFDDGSKTFIKMPKIADRVTLPVVWVMTSNGHKEPMDAMYKHPYFILNGLYQKIYLISGVGAHRIEVTINNKNITNA
jgi:P-type conjugative transfer protein TrbG|tara:strand:- start:32288 stop:33319 length:1032 start_codon:yes stop_codon:yes gene_type:complete